jgi:hypothetical protein
MWRRRGPVVADEGPVEVADADWLPIIHNFTFGSHSVTNVMPHILVRSALEDVAINTRKE